MLKKLPLAVLAVSGTAFGGIPLVTDDTGTQGTGGNQIEIAFTRDKAENGSRAREFALVYTRGLTDTVDAFVEKGRQKNTDPFGTSNSGYGNTLIGAKWRAWESERKTSFATSVTVALPVSATKEAEGFGTGKTSYDATLILAQEMEWGEVLANLGAGRENFRDSTEDAETTHFSVAPVLNLGEQFKLALDLGLDRSKTDTATANSRYAEIGVIYAPSEAVEFGLGYIRSKDKDSKEVTKSVTGGVTWHF